MHAGVLIRGMRRVERRVQQILDDLALSLVAHSESELLALLENLAWVAISTKFAQAWGRHLASLAASSVVGLGDLHFEQLKVMRLPGGSVSDSVSVAGVVVEGEVLRAPREREKDKEGENQTKSIPRIVLVDFEFNTTRGPVATNISSINDVDIWPQEDERFQSFLGQLVKSGISVVFSSQNCAANLFHFARHNIGVVHLVSAADMAMLSKCAGCQILSDPTQLFSETSSSSGSGDLLGTPGSGSGDFSESSTPLYGSVGSIEVTERSSRFVLVRNREDVAYGPRTILLRGGSGEVLAEASRGLNEAIAVVKCALINSKELAASSASPHSDPMSSTEHFAPSSPPPHSDLTPSPASPRSNLTSPSHHSDLTPSSPSPRSDLNSDKHSNPPSSSPHPGASADAEPSSPSSHINTSSSHPLSHASPPSADHFTPRCVSVLLGGGCVEMALASRLRSEYNSATSSDSAAARVFVKALEGVVHQLATNSGLKAEAISQLRMVHQKSSRSQSLSSLGIDGRAGLLQLKMYTVKQVVQAVVANAVQAVESILRIDTIISLPLAQPLKSLPM